MDTNVFSAVNFREMTLEELRSFNGGEPTKSTSFFYDAIYAVSYWITKSEILTFAFWEEWGYAIL